MTDHLTEAQRELHRKLDTGQLFFRIVEMADRRMQAVMHDPDGWQKAVPAIHEVNDDCLIASVGTNYDEVEVAIMDLIRKNPDLEVIRIPSDFAARRASFDIRKTPLNRLPKATQQRIRELDKVVDDPLMMIRVSRPEDADANLREQLHLASLF